jgi:DNA-binding NarL/FixJ family response regulator
VERSTRVVVCDGSEMARVGISRSLADHGLTIVDVASSAAVSLRLAETVEADVFLVDTCLPQSDMLISALVGLEIRVIATGVEAESDVPFTAIRAGAIGYLTKDLPSRAWAHGIAAAMRGEAPLSRAMTTRLVDAFRSQSVAEALSRLVPDDNRLTRREWDVLSRIAEGKTNRTVAEELCISVETVRSHVSSILAKLGTPNRSAAAVRYHQLLAAG